MDELKPRFPLRRFDVFADYHFVENERHGMPESIAKGRAIWAAKVVAGRRYGAAPSGAGKGTSGAAGKTAPEPEEEDTGFRSVGGVLQTDETFDKDIINRMGSEYYYKVFHPAIEQAVRDGKRYEDIRDSLRKTLSSPQQPQTS